MNTKRYLGLDVHKNSIVVATALANGSEAQPSEFSRIPLQDTDVAELGKVPTFVLYSEEARNAVPFLPAPHYRTSPPRKDR